MLESFKDFRFKIAIVLFVVLTLWWIGLQSIYKDNELLNEFFGVGYGVMALWGGICGLWVSKKWGGMKSVLGRGLAMFAFGLFAQEFGQVAYFYYVFIRGIEVPYPSLGDLGFFGSIPFYIYAIWLISKASGVKVGLKSYVNKIQTLILPLAMLAIAYFLFLNGHTYSWDQPLTTFLDFGYPFGQAIYISIALLTFLLTRNILGGVMKNKVLFILFALAIQFLADYTFLYQVSRETWTPNGVNDYLYLVAYFIMTVALLNVGTAVKTFKAKES